jgi:hypothetical protein
VRCADLEVETATVWKFRTAKNWCSYGEDYYYSHIDPTHFEPPSMRGGCRSWNTLADPVDHVRKERI